MPISVPFRVASARRHERAPCKAPARASEPRGLFALSSCVLSRRRGRVSLSLSRWLLVMMIFSWARGQEDCSFSMGDVS